jgi:hypothetical protein
VREKVDLNWMTPHTWRRTYATILDDEMSLTDRAKADLMGQAKFLKDTLRQPWRAAPRRCGLPRRRTAMICAALRGQSARASEDDRRPPARHYLGVTSRRVV